MRMWARTYIGDKRTAEYIYDCGACGGRDFCTNREWVGEVLCEISKEMDIERPVVNNKHLREMDEFGRTVFLPQDFMDAVCFEKLVFEVIE